MQPYISYQLGGEESGSSRVTEASEDPPHKRASSTGYPSTSFILVDPSNPNSKGGGRDARTSIRKHASKASAAQRLATLSERKRAQNTLTKRERRQQEATQRLEAALHQHIQKLASIKNYTGTEEAEISPGYEDEAGASNYSIGTSYGGYETTRSSVDSARDKCSISWLLSPATTPPTKDQSFQSLISNNQDQRTAPMYPTLDLLNERLLLNDPLAYTPLNITTDNRIRPLLSLFLGSICPLLDLRLPLKSDGSTDLRYAWSVALPRIMLSSEPLFWAMTLCAGTLQAGIDQQQPTENASIMKYRDLAIKSVNKRLQAPEKDIYFDLGLVSAIGSLGIWERLCGSKEIWHTHQKGVQMLSERLSSDASNRMLWEIITESQASDSLVWIDNHSEGFLKIREKVALDPQLVSAVCKCPLGEVQMLDESQNLTLQEQAKAILAWNSGSALCRVEGAAHDRRSVEMNVLLQGAGISMINFVDKTTIEGIEKIDFCQMTKEAVALANNVSLVPSYDQLLLWASATIFALNNYTEPAGMRIVAKIARRCLVTTWEQLNSLLRTFVYVEAATEAYVALWSSVESNNCVRP